MEPMIIGLLIYIALMVTNVHRVVSRSSGYQPNKGSGTSSEPPSE